MALSELEQAQTILNKANHVLLIVPDKASLDSLASMIALYLTLTLPPYTFSVDEVSLHHVPSRLQFLPGSSQVATKPRLEPEVILDIAGPTATAHVRSEPLTGGLRLHLTFPTGTLLTADQLATSIRALPYDVIITLGAPDLEALGTNFVDHADFFYNTPIINIDHTASNEHFGTVNLVDITKSSVAEVTYELIAHLTHHELDTNIATALYAGIVAGTDSFQHPNTTPHSFKLAAELLETKADRDAVIRYLVKTKPLSLLKLLGRLYARLRHDEHLRLFWSILRPIDFVDSGAASTDLPQALRELANNLTDYNALVVLHQTPVAQDFVLYLMLGKGLTKRRAEIQQALAATKDNGLLQLSFSADSLEAAETKALDQLRQALP
jgi:nanoRNase/pAp phosphatase (c-di-AMP/oligoRNAs hydrolase)